MMFGLIVAGFIISVMSSWLENIFRDIRGGLLDYHGGDHTLIVNYNSKLENILSELDSLHVNQNDLHEIVVFLSDEADVEKLQSYIKFANFRALDVSVRLGDVEALERYISLSLYSIHALIILADEHIASPLVRDNHNIRIVNLLYNDAKFQNYLKTRQQRKHPIKAVVELHDLDCAGEIIHASTQSLFVAMAPEEILGNVLKLSMINIDFYNIWSELLSFDGYELYFVNPKKYDLVGLSYAEIVLRQKEGMLLGISRVIDGEFRFLLNTLDENIKQNDWLLFIARHRDAIAFTAEAIKVRSEYKIAQSKEIFEKDIIVIGDKRSIEDNEFLDVANSSLRTMVPLEEELLYQRSYYDQWLLDQNCKVDTIILNLDDELVFRIALALKQYYSPKEMEHFVYLIDDPKIAEHLHIAGIKNTIISHVLVSKYIAQVSNQISLSSVFDILFTQKDAEVNLIDVQKLPSELLRDRDKLQYELVANKMTYLGVVQEDNTISFGATNVQKAKKIIVLSNGIY